jgi:hypothetical protein
MVQIDIPWTFLIGSTLAEADQIELGKSPTATQTPSFLLGMAFISLLFNPASMYLVWRYPGWETMYRLDDRHLSALVPAVFVLVLSVMYTLGYIFGHRWLRGNRRPSLPWVNIIASAALLAFLGVSYRRFLFLGSTQEFNGGNPPNLLGSSLFRDLCIMALLLAPTYCFINAYFRRRGKNISAGQPPKVTRPQWVKVGLIGVGMGLGSLVGAVLLVVFSQWVLLR